MLFVVEGKKKLSPELNDVIKNVTPFSQACGICNVSVFWILVWKRYGKRPLSEFEFGRKGNKKIDNKQREENFIGRINVPQDRYKCRPV
jgi:hypothetical protein